MTNLQPPPIWKFQTHATVHIWYLMYFCGPRYNGIENKRSTNVNKTRSPLAYWQTVGLTDKAEFWVANLRALPQAFISSIHDNAYSSWWPYINGILNMTAFGLGGYFVIAVCSNNLNQSKRLSYYSYYWTRKATLYSLSKIFGRVSAFYNDFPIVRLIW